jgi:signal transduction histidine kinase
MKRPTPRPSPIPGSAFALVMGLALFGNFLASAQAGAPASGDSNAPVLTTGLQVQLLSQEGAAKKFPAVLRGVVTCYLPDSDSLVIQDATRGVYVSQISAALNEAPRLGDLFEIEGVTDPGQFAPQLLARKAKRLGVGELPVPVQPTWDQLINGSFDTQFIEIHGVITAVHPDSVTLLTHAGKVVAHLYGTNEVSKGNALARYKDSKIRICGCMFAMWDARTRQVRVGEISMQVANIAVDEPAPKNLFALPQRHASELRLFDPEASLLRRVLVRGQIVQHRKGEFLAMDGTAGFRFIPTEPATLEVGDLVDVVGFASLTGPSPALLEAVARKTGSAPLPQARSLDPENLFDAKLDATRVRVEAVLRSFSADQRILELQSGLVGFLAQFDPAKPAAVTNQIKAVAPPGFNAPLGSQLALTGVYLGHGGAPSDGGQIGSFELLLNSPADIVVLARAPFWTLPRLLILIAALVGVLCLAVVWIQLLHHQVQARTAELKVEVREREHAEQQRALAVERSRIARDLHDDLGSSLTEVSLLATAAPGQPIAHDEVSERLDAIAQKSRTMVHALDELVWAVDPERDTLSSVARYLASYAEEYLAGLKIPCRVQIPPVLPERGVPGQMRHELFLAVKEALNNAVRHGQPSEVGFGLHCSGSQLEISVADNGKGFDPADQHDQHNGHGLANLKTRLQNMGGRCEIESSAGHGTTVLMRLPFNSTV